MNKFACFLRGINVGGKNMIKMEQLKALFASLGAVNCKTYIQSGNLIFETTENNTSILKKQIENRLLQHMNSPIVVILRSAEEMQTLILGKPAEFGIEKADEKYYVCITEQITNPLPTLPLIVEKEGLEFIKVINNDILIISRRIGDRYGFPNNYVEKKFAIYSTARNWNTIEKMASEF